MLVAIFLLLAIGIVMVFSSSSYAAMVAYNDVFYYLKRQLAWAGLGLLFMAVARRIPYRNWQRLVKPLFVTAVALLLAVLVIGVTAKGASRWLGLGPFHLQPSELIKPVMVLYLASYLSHYRTDLSSWRGVWPALVALAVVCGLILAQPDLGTAVVIAGTTYAMLYAAGANRRHLVVLALLGVAAGLAAIVVAPYRMERLLAIRDPFADPGDTGFQTVQSLYALGSGGPLGVGLGFSRQKYLYVPERHTDFIFAILGEELGFIGGTIVLILFFVLFWRGLQTALKAPDEFGSLLAAGITLMVAVQVCINLGVVMGVMPVTGITLPLISYGGSSLLFTLFSLGVLLNISQHAWKV
ncbi:MAG: putative lipid II flippase FtsW [Clostridia bacterium]|nr:MAG: putative lipid II flippase FtsW [Clostridia bacterium]